MSGSRPSIFDDNIDLTGFEPKAGPEPGAVPSQTSRRIAEEGGFPSRAPVLRPPAAARPSSPKTGRTVLLNARITQQAHDRFHEIVAAEQARYATGEIMHRVTLGEIVERALQALDREMLKREKKGQGT
jgi:hypothetical protein